MDYPFFTVIIPTYNRFSLLKRSVQSVINQTYKNFEMIIVDDNSTDHTSTIVDLFSDPRIKYKLNNRSKGACGARNTGIHSARGKWVAFLDDDDVWFPEKLEYQYDIIIKSRNTVGLVCSDYTICKGNVRKTKIIKNRPIGWMKNKILFGYYIGCLSSTCVRTNILLNIKGFDETFPSCQDQDLWLRVSAVSEFNHVPKTLVYFIQDSRKDRIGLDAKKKLDGWIAFRNKNSKFIDKNFILKHRFESQIFIYAFLQKQKSFLLKALPWVILGAFFKFPHFLRTIRSIAVLAHRRAKITNT